MNAMYTLRISRIWVYQRPRLMRSVYDERADHKSWPSWAHASTHFLSIYEWKWHRNVIFTSKLLSFLHIELIIQNVWYSIYDWGSNDWGHDRCLYPWLYASSINKDHALNDVWIHPQGDIGYKWWRLSSTEDGVSSSLTHLVHGHQTLSGHPHNSYEFSSS